MRARRQPATVLQLAVAAWAAALLAGATGLASGAASDTTPDCPSSVGGRPLTNDVLQGDPDVDAELTCYYEPPDQPSYSITVSWVTSESDGHNTYGCGQASPDPARVFVSPDHEADSSVNTTSAPPAFADAAKQLLAEVSQRFAKPCANAKPLRFKFKVSGQSVARAQTKGYLSSRIAGNGTLETSQLAADGTGKVKRASGGVVIVDRFRRGTRGFAIRVTRPAFGETGRLTGNDPGVSLRGVVSSEHLPHCRPGARAFVELNGSPRSTSDITVDACGLSWTFSGRGPGASVFVSIASA